MTAAMDHVVAAADPGITAVASDERPRPGTGTGTGAGSAGARGREAVASDGCARSRAR